MYSIVQVPDHWSQADEKDIERELVGMLIERKHLNYDLRPDRDYELIWAFDNPDQFCTYFSVYIYSVRRICYHAPSKPGWLPLRRSRVVRRAGEWVEVKWSSVKRIDTPARADRDYGYRAFRCPEWRSIVV